MPILLQINSAKNCGSTGKIAEQIASVAQNHGWDTYIAHGHRYNRGGSIAGYQVTGKYGEYAHLIKSYLADGQGLGSTVETKKFINWIDAIKPDIIHLHNIHGYYINYKLLFEYLSSKDIPLVWTLHDCWSFTGHCTYFDRIGCEKWLTHCESCPQKKSYPKSFSDRSGRNYELKKRLFTAIKNLTIVPVSDWLNGLVSDSYLGKYPIRTIHNGIDLNVFKPSDSNFRKKNNLKDKFVILGVADGYGDRKGLPEFNRLSEELGDEVKVMLVGLEENEKKQVSDKIIAMGRTKSQQELVDIYSMADVYVNPTYEDNFPTTNLEALACGTPVITYKTGGSPEAVDGNTGYVVEKGDFEGLLKVIKVVLSQGKEHYTIACRERAENCFDKNARFLDYIKLYESLTLKR